MVQLPDFMGSARSTSCATTWNASIMTYEEWYETTLPFQQWCIADLQYALPTVYFSCGMIALFILSNVLGTMRARRAATKSSSKIVSFLRFLASRQVNVQILNWYSPSLGVTIVGALMVVFIFALMFSNHKFYWENFNMGHSPPLGTRGGWVSLAIMPFMLTFATKANPIALLTGTSHEKLQIWHRWSAWLMYFAALVHTLPFIVYNIRWGQMEARYAASAEYWTGIACLVPMTWLLFMSVGPIRRWCYELFKKLHIIGAILFIIFFMFHCANTLTSWQYFYATFALYGFSFLTRLARLLPCFDVVIDVLPSNTVKITIPVHPKCTWKPGQHFFVRFIGPSLGLHSFSSHPFTVASVPSVGGADNTVEMYVRGYRGITGRLGAVAAILKGRGVTAVLDGPYGGLHTSVQGFNRVLLLAGGSGATFTLPIMTDICRAISAGSTTCSKVDFIIAAPSYDSIEWCEDYCTAARTMLESNTGGKGSALAVSVYITRQDASSSSATVDEEKGEADGTQKFRHGAIHREGRPDLKQLIRSACDEQPNGSVAVICCGPDEFSYAVRNAVASCELDIALGRLGCRDLFLHTEAYSW
ncbi:uncharacterized protein STEHIDRAFT_117735 [Stereum hirsutum FP-91666 SS1]|uniref:uncharacterized protein n=1 Tax=Stereum hirsutum (strain FP-91666) TaxID=721885 RepID=UPI000440B828|nr:uncharacterized protein STEHIDRAFT_117735 [Stereum hirsutum FP-91666 SS1]EIM92768.1 hypothetical protein STEHIDRAFT_117735 [Stereum hirsutum FP-91666 SS1]